MLEQISSQHHSASVEVVLSIHSCFCLGFFLYALFSLLKSQTFIHVGKDKQLGSTGRKMASK